MSPGLHRGGEGQEESDRAVRLIPPTLCRGQVLWQLTQTPEVTFAHITFHMQSVYNAEMQWFLIYCDTVLKKG